MTHIGRCMLTALMSSAITLSACPADFLSSNNNSPEGAFHGSLSRKRSSPRDHDSGELPFFYWVVAFGSNDLGWENNPPDSSRPIRRVHGVEYFLNNSNECMPVGASILVEGAVWCHETIGPDEARDDVEVQIIQDGPVAFSLSPKQSVKQFATTYQEEEDYRWHSRMMYDRWPFNPDNDPLPTKGYDELYPWQNPTENDNVIKLELTRVSDGFEIVVDNNQKGAFRVQAPLFDPAKRIREIKGICLRDKTADLGLRGFTEGPCSGPTPTPPGTTTSRETTTSQETTIHSSTTYTMPGTTSQETTTHSSTTYTIPATTTSGGPTASVVTSTGGAGSTHGSTSSTSGGGSIVTPIIAGAAGGLLLMTMGAAGLCYGLKPVNDETDAINDDVSEITSPSGTSVAASFASQESGIDGEIINVDPENSFWNKQQKLARV